MASKRLAITIFLVFSTANIIFPFVQPKCDHGAQYPGCLPGQRCLSSNLHLFSPEPKLTASSSLTAKLHSSTDLPPSATPSPTADDNEPVIHPVPPAMSVALLGKAPDTSDGTCGASHGGSVCGQWPQGSCCSMYGFCGNTTAHCGPGCQSGPCDQAPALPALGPSAAPMNPNPGTFDIIGRSGVPAMHAALMPNGRVMFLDKVENYTELRLPDGYYAYSSEYNPETNQAVPLQYKTNAFCAGGSFLANGTLMSVGGNGPLTWLDPTVDDGFRGLRYLTRSSSDTGDDGQQSWVEPGNKLNTPRWYPSVQSMPDGTLFVASGSLNGLDPTKMSNNNPTYEILNVDGTSQGVSIPMSLLEKAQPYYMYPFIHLMNDGTLFIFTSKSSQIFNVANNAVVKSLPDLPGDYRTYPNTGGSVLLPLSSSTNWTAEVVICGGGAYQDITSPTDASCGRITPQSPDAKWELDSMPEGRGMVEGTLLPDGTVVWVNGAGEGAQGFGLAQEPALEALIYKPAAQLGQRWTRGATSTIPRLYHSVALLLLDGTLLVAGSNPVQMPVLTPSSADPYVTEFRVERYTPPYLSGPGAEARRPTGVEVSAEAGLKADGSQFKVSFVAPSGGGVKLQVALYHGGFVTHSLHMSHRMLFLDTQGFQPGQTEQKVEVTMPPNHNVAPPGPYVLYVVVDGVPAMGQFVTVL